MVERVNEHTWLLIGSNPLRGSSGQTKEREGQVTLSKGDGVFNLKIRKIISNHKKKQRQKDKKIRK